MTELVSNTNEQRVPPHLEFIRSDIEFIVKKISDTPASTSVSIRRMGLDVIFMIHSSDKDRGIIIGKGGVMIEGLRTIFHSFCIKKGIKAHLKINEPNRIPKEY